MISVGSILTWCLLLSIAPLCVLCLLLPELIDVLVSIIISRCGRKVVGDEAVDDVGFTVNIVVVAVKFWCQEQSTICNQTSRKSWQGSVYPWIHKVSVTRSILTWALLANNCTASYLYFSVMGEEEGGTCFRLTSTVALTKPGKITCNGCAFKISILKSDQDEAVLIDL